MVQVASELGSVDAGDLWLWLGHTLGQLWGPHPAPSLLSGPPAGGGKWSARAGDQSVMDMSHPAQWSGSGPQPFSRVAIW